jgi:iron complex outermembrane receptor protein
LKAKHPPRVGRGLARVLVSSAVAAALASSAALAQQQDQEDLMEVTVTAQKREQSLQDVPISMTVVDGAELANRSIKGFEDFSTLVPNFNVVRTPGVQAIFMRGIGSGPGSPSLDQSVVMFVDGIYGGRARQFMTPFLDVQRIEVLRGPQGALVGKNTSAGAISIVSARPTDKLEARLGAEYDFDLEGPTLDAVVSGPVTENFGLRLAARYQDIDGYIRNSLTGHDEPLRDEKAGRLTAVYEIGNFTITGKAEIAKLRLDGNPIQVFSARINRPIDYNKETKSVLGPDFDTNESKTGVLTVDWQLGDFTLTSITGYSKYETREGVDADFFERDLAYSRFDEDFSQTSQELRLLSPTGGRFEYVVGAYWHHNDLLELRTTATTFAPAGNTIRFFDQGSSTVSAYTQATWNVSPQFAAVLGLRYTKEDKDASYIRIGGANSTTTGVGTVQASFADSVSEGEVDPALSLQWRPDGDHMIYGSYSQGSKSGGFQGAISNATPAAFKFKPEKSDSLEFGYKQTYGGKGYLDVVLFHTKYQDLQSSTALPTTASGSSFAFFTGNAGEATAKGIESNWAYRFSEHVKVNGALAYMDAKYGQYAEGPCITGQTPNNAARGSCDNSNIDLPFSSKWSGNVTATWSSDLGSSMKLDVSLTANFRSSFRAEFAPDPLFVEGGYTKYDARIGLSFGDAWELALLGRNLTDKKTFSFATAAALANNPALGISPDARLGVVDPPRTVALQARYKFQ